MEELLGARNCAEGEVVVARNGLGLRGRERHLNSVTRGGWKAEDSGSDDQWQTEWHRTVMAEVEEYPSLLVFCRTGNYRHERY